MLNKHSNESHIDCLMHERFFVVEFVMELFSGFQLKWGKLFFAFFLGNFVEGRLKFFIWVKK